MRSVEEQSFPSLSAVDTGNEAVINAARHRHEVDELTITLDTPYEQFLTSDMMVPFAGRLSRAQSGAKLRYRK